MFSRTVSSKTSCELTVYTYIHIPTHRFVWYVFMYIHIQLDDKEMTNGESTSNGQTRTFTESDIAIVRTLVYATLYNKVCGSVGGHHYIVMYNEQALIN